MVKLNSVDEFISSLLLSLQLLQPNTFTDKSIKNGTFFMNRVTISLESVRFEQYKLFAQYEHINEIKGPSHFLVGF